MKVVNVTKNTVVATNVKIAASFLARSRGLLGRRGLNPAEGLLLRPCNSIQMFFMRFALDVVFLSRDGVVIRAIRELKPWRLSPVICGSYQALELPAGTVQASQIEAGDFLLVAP